MIYLIWVVVAILVIIYALGAWFILMQWDDGGEEQEVIARAITAVFWPVVMVISWFEKD